MLSRLQYISQGTNDPQSHIRNIEEVLDAGVTLVQLRLKNIDTERYIEQALKAKELSLKYNATLIINDNTDVAKAVGANALHLGLNDLPVEDARKIVGEIIIGGTANTFDDILKRNVEKVNYIGLGPFRFTNTKEKLSPILGIEGYKNILSQMKKENIDIPVYAIGGIELQDIKNIMQTGVYGIAVSGLLTNSNNKTKLVKEINILLNNA